MSKPLEEVKKLTIGQLAALVHAIGGLVAVKAILRDKGLAKRVAEFISEAVKVTKKTEEVVDEVAEEEFFTAISDKDAPAHLAEAVVKWRKLASDLGYTGPVLWAVKAGFTLKKHAPLAGPCYEQFKYLQDWELKNDEPTSGCMVFFIPRIIATGKDVEEQKQALAELRAKYDLPASPLNSFGPAAMIAGLILAHFKRTGERAPLNIDWVRTDTLDSDGRRLSLGDFDENGLYCGLNWLAVRLDNLGVFPLGWRWVTRTLGSFLGPWYFRTLGLFYLFSRRKVGTPTLRRG